MKLESTNVDQPPSTSSSRSHTTEGSLRKTWSVTRVYIALSSCGVDIWGCSGEGVGIFAVEDEDEGASMGAWEEVEEEDAMAFGVVFGGEEEGAPGECLYRTERCELRKSAQGVLGGIMARLKRPW